MRTSLGLLAGVACLLALTGCVDLIRRPDSAAADGWRMAGPEGADTLSERAGQPASVVQDTTTPASRPRSGRRHQGGTLGQSSADRRARIRDVNQYALWCIRRSLWNEARSHLERALKQDSLAPSLYNNLAIIYEHVGQTDSAAAYYRRALELSADTHPYQRNLKGLERQRNAAGDTIATIDLFELKQRVPGPRRAPY